jgi:hypothetical protein
MFFCVPVAFSGVLRGMRSGAGTTKARSLTTIDQPIERARGWESGRPGNIWDELAAGTPGEDTPVGVHLTLTASAEPPET